MCELLACSGCVIKLYSAATGVQVRLLQGHTADVTAVTHSPTSVLQALSAGLDGRIILWDLDEAFALRSICVGLPILSMVLHPLQSDSAFILTGRARSSSHRRQSKEDSASEADGGGVSYGMHWEVALELLQDCEAWAT